MQQKVKESHRLVAIQRALGDRYRIVRKIATGGFGDVYLGEHSQLGRRVAIKVLLRSLGEDQEVVRRFERESRAEAKLNHTNINDIYDVGDGVSEEEAVRIHYFVMKYIDGEMLAGKLLREERFVPAEAIQITSQLAVALAYAHARAVIHRDIKPTNVMLDEFSKPILMDFGVARIQFEGILTQKGALMGTPHYLAPEQALGKMVDGRSDIYSLGIMFYEMLTGHLPFRDETPVRVIFRHIHEPAPRLDELMPELSEDLCGIVHKMIEKSPEKRYQSAAEIVQALQDLPEMHSARTSISGQKNALDENQHLIKEVELKECYETVRMSLEMNDVSEATESLARALSIDPSNEEGRGLAQQTQEMILKQVDRFCEQLDFHGASHVLHLARDTFPETAKSKLVVVDQNRALYEKFVEAKNLFQQKDIKQAIKKYQDFLETPSLYDYSVFNTLKRQAEDTLRMAQGELQLQMQAEPASLNQWDVAEPIPAKASNVKVTRRFLWLAVVMAVTMMGMFFWLKWLQSSAEVRHEPGSLTLPARFSRPALGKIAIVSEPAGATILLGDEQRGIAPLEIIGVPFGRYLLNARLEGYKPLQKEVELTAGNSILEMTIKLESAEPVTGTLIIQSRPLGARIFLGGKEIGLTPKTFPGVLSGRHKVILKKEGYKDYAGSIRVKPEQITMMAPELIEIPKPVAERVEPDVKPGMLVTMASDVIPPDPVKRTYAKYPEAAKAQKLAGTVRLSLLVSETGKVLAVNVEESAHPILDAAAVEALKRWHFQPATKRGIPVKIWIPFTWKFASKR